jgi:lipid-binding SYLF domain-containing protein
MQLKKELTMNRKSLFATAVAATLLTAGLSIPASEPATAAATADELTQESRQALDNLAAQNALARDIAGKARAVLVFPNIVKAGLVFGGAYGEGVLLEGGAAADYYNSFTGSWGLQAGAQSYSYAVFLMNDNAVKYLRDSDGWEIGVGPTVVVVDEGVAKNLSTSTLKDDAYAFIFGQQGLMAGVSIEGTKVSRIKRSDAGTNN